MKAPLLELKNLTRRFSNGRVALDNVNLVLPAGGFTVLAGPNGSGKTVLMRHLNGLARPDSGEVLIEGRPVLKNLKETRRRVGLVFQDADAQIVGQTVAKDVAFGPENLGLAREKIDQRVASALQATGLVSFDDRRPHTLSGGEKRRLAVAGVIAMSPDILVLDEPFTGLDWPGCADLLTVLEDYHRRGNTLILITHDLEKVLALADRLVILSEGQVTEDGTPERIVELASNYGIRRPNGDVAQMSWKR